MTLSTYSMEVSGLIPPLVTQAALAGDKAALDILDRAGTVLGEQLDSLCRMEGLNRGLPVALSGSVWRGHRAILSAFTRTVKGRGFTGEIIVPDFEPVVGILLGHYFETHDVLGTEQKAHLKEMYRDHLFTGNLKKLEQLWNLCSGTDSKGHF